IVDKHSNMFSPIRLPKSIRSASAAFGVLLLSMMLALPAQAQSVGLERSEMDLLSGQSSSSLSSSSGEREFLKVTEAYVLSVEPRGREVVLHWDIAPDYYLYRDNFKVRAYSDGR